MSSNMLRASSSNRKHERRGYAEYDAVAESEQIRMLRRRIELERAANEPAYIERNRRILERDNNDDWERRQLRDGAMSRALQRHQPSAPRRRPQRFTTNMHLMRQQEQTTAFEQRIRHAEQYRTDLVNELRLRRLSRRQSVSAAVRRTHATMTTATKESESDSSSSSSRPAGDVGSPRPKRKSCLVWDSPPSTPVATTALSK